MKLEYLPPVGPQEWNNLGGYYGHAFRGEGKVLVILSITLGYKELRILYAAGRSDAIAKVVENSLATFSDGARVWIDDWLARGGWGNEPLGFLTFSLTKPKIDPSSEIISGDPGVIIRSVLYAVRGRLDFTPTRDADLFDDLRRGRIFQ